MPLKQPTIKKAVAFSEKRKAMGKKMSQAKSYHKNALANS